MIITRLLLVLGLAVSPVALGDQGTPEVEPPIEEHEDPKQEHEDPKQED